jgi:hypothetical protein
MARRTLAYAQTGIRQAADSGRAKIPEGSRFAAAASCARARRIRGLRKVETARARDLDRAKIPDGGRCGSCTAHCIGSRLAAAAHALVPTFFAVRAPS